MQHPSPNSNRFSYDLKSVLEMLHEITAHGTRRECSRQQLLMKMSERNVDLNVTRMLKDGLLRQEKRTEELYYVVPELVFNFINHP